MSRDGKFVAFLSGREGHTDVWVTQPGSGQFHNLTHGNAPELVNPSVRVLGFSPDGSWSRSGFANRPAKAGKSGYGQCPPWADNPARIWKARRSSIGRTTVRDSLTIRLTSGDPLFVSDGATHPRPTDLYHARGPPFSLSDLGAR